MARPIDEKKKRKALRKLRKAAERAEAENGPGLSDWEREFVEEVEMRVETYGSAFADPEKGNLDEPLSALQMRKLKEIDKKSRGKETGFRKRSGFSKSKAKAKTAFRPRVRDIHEDVEDAPPAPTALSERPAKLTLVRSEKAQTKTDPATDKVARRKPAAKGKPPTQPKPAASPFRVIEGGKQE